MSSLYKFDMYRIIIHNIENITQEATLKDQHGGTRLGGIDVGRGRVLRWWWCLK